VIRELQRLSSEGFQECVLTGIHIGTYGRDLSPATTLLDLMRRIEEENPIYRVRLSSIDPEEVTDEMIDFLSRSKAFCHYLHIPVQSGDDPILKLMRRRYTAAEFQRLSLRLKEKMPEVCLGTDVMVGFPYEDEERFLSSYQLLQDSPIDYLHVFPYSAKKKTRAASFLHQVSPREKKERVGRMTALSRQKRDQFYKNSLGSFSEIILEETVLEDLPNYRKGISRNYVPVHVPEKDLPPSLSRSNPAGERGRVILSRIDRYDGGKLFGEIIA
jgi:threonylcarbamoyladenosine tRNA methylthiotransferase MtaB